MIKNPYCHLRFAFVPEDAEQGGQLYIQQITGAKWRTSHRPGYVSVAVKSKEQQPPSFVYSCRLPQAVMAPFFFFFFAYWSYITDSNEMHKDKS